MVRKSKFIKGSRSYIMSRIRARDTSPELKVRRYLFSHGMRYRLYVSSLPGRPDIVLKKYKTAIFIHGCFWHSHGCRLNGNPPKTNSEFWEEKFRTNRKRDAAKELELRRMGWKVLVIWECEICDNKINEVMNEIKANIGII